MCREILEAHHGRIRVDSTPGKGTAFTLKLPVAHDLVKAALAPGASVPSTATPSAPAPLR